MTAEPVFVGGLDATTKAVVDDAATSRAVNAGFDVVVERDAAARLYRVRRRDGLIVEIADVISVDPGDHDALVRAIAARPEFVVGLDGLLERAFVESLERRFSSRPLTRETARLRAVEALRDAAQVVVSALPDECFRATVAAGGEHRAFLERVLRVFGPAVPAEPKPAA